jgi:PAS domain S-box-containing protein
MTERTGDCRTPIDALPASVFEAGLDGRLTYANPHALALLGLTPPGLYSGNINLFGPPGPATALRTADTVHRLRAGGAPVTETVAFRAADGIQRQLQAFIGPVYEGESLVGFRGVLFDVTAHAATEQALADSRDLLRRIFDASPDIVVAFDRAGRVTSVNPAFEKYSGWPADSWIGRDLAELADAPDRAEARARIRRVMFGETVPETEYAVRTRSGERRILQSHSIPLREQGRVVGGVTISRDVTEQRQAEESARSLDSVLTKAFRIFPDAIVISRLSDGRIVQVNDAFTRESGYSADEAVGQRAIDLNLWAKPEQRGEFVRRLLESGEVRGFEAELRARDGSSQPSLLTATLLDFDRTPCIFLVSHNITGRRDLEAQLITARKMEAGGRKPLTPGETAKEVREALDAGEADS